MRTLLATALMVIALPVAAEKLTIEKIFDGGGLSGPTPRGVKISPDGSRVTFLRAKADDQFQLDLWEYNVQAKSTRLLVDSKKLEPKAQELTDEEKARRERARTAGFKGIVGYQWSPDGKQLLFPIGGKLYLYDLAAGTPRELQTGGAVIDPKISPKGNYVSYVREQNLWVIDLRTDKALALTQDGKGTVHNGEAEFVAQEEMRRFAGYWWAADDSLIAFERYDEKNVPIVKRTEVYPDRTEVIEQRYPAAGDPNVEVQLGLVAPAGGAARFVDLGKEKDIYLVRVDWVPNSTQLTYQVMPRSQQQLDLKVVDVRTLAQRTLITETSKTWINVLDDLHFLDDDKTFIWGSERSGHHHLYLYGLDGKLERAISAGEWDLDGFLAVDQKSREVFVSSNRDFAPDRQVYALKLDGSTANSPRRVSQGDGTHGAEFAKDASFYVDVFSNPMTPPQVSIRSSGDGGFLAWIEENKLDEHHPFWPYRDGAIKPEFGTVKSEDGQDLYYKLFKPANFDPKKRYPVFDNFYGGPGVQFVTRGWGDFFAQYMAQQGFVVFSLDNRGMGRRGRRFSDVIYRTLGVAEVADQLAGVQWLKSQPWVDGKRVGIFGWSYGGFMTTMLLAKASKEFAGGVAVAPVTDWKLYDTFYTERYLQRPQDNEAGYEKSAPLPFLDGLTAPIYIVHGMADDNVLFVNSTKLMAALQKKGTQFQLMTYPGGKHGLAMPGQRTHVYHLIANQFETQIKKS